MASTHSSVPFRRTTTSLPCSAWGISWSVLIHSSDDMTGPGGALWLKCSPQTPAGVPLSGETPQPGRPALPGEIARPKQGSESQLRRHRQFDLLAVALDHDHRRVARL